MTAVCPGPPGTLPGHAWSTSSGADAINNKGQIVGSGHTKKPGPMQLLPPDVRHHRMPIPDLTCPPTAQVAATLDLVDRELGSGGVYVRGWGGCGRTGSIVGCWLVRHGVTSTEALAAFARASAPVALRQAREQGA